MSKETFTPETREDYRGTVIPLTLTANKPLREAFRYHTIEPHEKLVKKFKRRWYQVEDRLTLREVKEIREKCTACHGSTEGCWDCDPSEPGVVITYEPIKKAGKKKAGHSPGREPNIEVRAGRVAEHHPGGPGYFVTTAQGLWIFRRLSPTQASWAIRFARDLESATARILEFGLFTEIADFLRGKARTVQRLHELAIRRRVSEHTRALLIAATSFGGEADADEELDADADQFSWELEAA